MQFSKVCLPGLCSFTLLALLCTSIQAQNTTDEPLPEGVLAMVNGRPIPQLSVDNVARQITESGQQAVPEQILEELINLEILTQAAEALSMEQDEDIAAALQLQYTQTMANAYLARKSSEMSFTEEQLRAEYDAQSAAADTAEFRASHILLESAADAQKVLDELAEGKEFAALASEYSVDPTGENGGDLGWFQTATMVPEFSAAVATMQTGEVSATAVESEYGFHIIKLIDKRNSALPDFESVKPGLTNLAVRKALSIHVEELKADAQIQVNP